MKPYTEDSFILKMPRAWSTCAINSFQYRRLDSRTSYEAKSRNPVRPPKLVRGYELRDFLKRSGFPFEWIDLKTDGDQGDWRCDRGSMIPSFPFAFSWRKARCCSGLPFAISCRADWFRGPKHEAI